jgi:hypothetical protein
MSLIGGNNAENSLETSFVVQSGLVPGGIYRFTYRALNANGWS